MSQTNDVVEIEVFLHFGRNLRRQQIDNKRCTGIERSLRDSFLAVCFQWDLAICVLVIGSLVAALVSNEDSPVRETWSLSALRPAL